MEEISAITKMPVSAKARLSKLIDDYQKLIFSICYKITGDYFTAEDLTQETFLSAYQKYDTFDGANEKAWICRIATNKSIDYIRNSGRRSVPVEDIFFTEQCDTGGSPEEICIEEDIKQKLKERCDSLKPPYDEIARAYYLEERSPAEIATARNQKIKTIQTQIYRARDMLRKLYGREEIA